MADSHGASGGFRLTERARAAGCAAKLGPATLSRILRALPPVEHEDLLVGTSTADDAGVFRIAPDLALVQTVDFFTPIVDDPFQFGAIAAANAGSVFTLLAWGLLADRVGERFVLGAGLAGCGAGLLVAAFAPSFAVLVLALTLGGASGASVNAASVALDYIEARIRYRLSAPSSD